MNKATVIANRELAGYFYSPIAYVVMAVFLLFTGIIFMMDFVPGQPAGMRNLFQWMLFLMVPAIPFLSMGLMSQEWSTGTVETLMTAPVSEIEVILGKFFGALTFLFILLTPTLAYVLLLVGYSTMPMDFGPILSGYLGIILAGALFLSIGLFCSCLTRSQMISAVMGIAILCVLTILPMILSEKVMLAPWIRSTVDFLVYRRYLEFSRGILDTSHLVFFLSHTVLFLFFSVKALESRRWK
jgi:ABC-2 type transport system permease protein